MEHGADRRHGRDREGRLTGQDRTGASQRIGTAVLAGIGGTNQAAKKKSLHDGHRKQRACLGLNPSSISALAGCKTQMAGIESDGLKLAQWLCRAVGGAAAAE
jgi:hypothetical protein